MVASYQLIRGQIQANLILLSSVRSKCNNSNLLCVQNENVIIINPIVVPPNLYDLKGVVQKVDYFYFFLWYGGGGGGGGWGWLDG